MTVSFSMQPCKTKPHEIDYPHTWTSFVTLLFFWPSPCHRLSCWASFISAGNKRFKETCMQSNGILNPGCRGNNCVGRQKKKMLGELISAERWEKSDNGFFKPIWDKERAREKDREEKKESGQEMNFLIMNYHLAPSVALPAIISNPESFIASFYSVFLL